jgi:hypothetical protein
MAKELSLNGSAAGLLPRIDPASIDWINSSSFIEAVDFGGAESVVHPKIPTTRKMKTILKSIMR